MDLLNNGGIRLFNGDALFLYSSWGTPTVIISDGPYGVKGFPGDLVSIEGLGEWYEPHIIEWAKCSTPQTTLWFWNTELGWANVHPFLNKHGWEYKACCVWNKGMSHVAGNINTKTISKLPVVSEVCVQYVRKAEFCVEGITYSMKGWLRYEWGRTGLAFSKTNDACGVIDAATRKYFTKCHLWYMPPADAFEKIASYANTYGDPKGRPYFSIDGERPISREEWQTYRAKFYCPMGLTNVWSESQLKGKERLKKGTKAAHFNQKPLKLIETTISISSDEGDVVWDPFGGLFTTAIACCRQNRQCFTAEIRPDVYKQAFAHAMSIINQPEQLTIESSVLAR
jgi:site-specific DNA-methyltransferase (adenine-specific)